jgi:hypothetical protein
MVLSVDPGLSRDVPIVVWFAAALNEIVISRRLGFVVDEPIDWVAASLSWGLVVMWGGLFVTRSDCSTAAPGVVASVSVVCFLTNLLLCCGASLLVLVRTVRCRWIEALGGLASILLTLRGYGWLLSTSPCSRVP